MMGTCPFRKDTIGVNEACMGEKCELFVKGFNRCIFVAMNANMGKVAQALAAIKE